MGMYKVGYGVNLVKYPIGCWDIGVTIIHEWQETYLCIGLIKWQLQIGRVTRWEDDL